MAFTRLCNRICNILFWGLLASLKFVNSLFATAPDPTYYFQINIELPLFTSRHKSQQFPLSVLDQLWGEREGRPEPFESTLDLPFAIYAQTSCRLIYNSHIWIGWQLYALAYGKSLLIDFFRRRIPNAESGKKVWQVKIESSLKFDI